MDPNIWIADMGASNHMKPHKDDMIGAERITPDAPLGAMEQNLKQF